MSPTSPAASGSDGAASMDNIVAFPDLSGLRATAPTRKPKRESSSSAFDITQTLDTELAVADLAKVAEGGLIQALRLAWAISLYHIQAHETDVFAFDQLDAQSPSRTRQIRFRIARVEPSKLSLQDFAALLESGVDTKPPSSMDTAVLDLSTADPSQTASAELKRYAALLVARTNGDKLRIELSAASTVHSDESARFQLQQLESLLQSFLNDAPGTPALAATRLPAHLLSLDTDNFRFLENDLGPGGLQEERIEHQFERRAKEHPDAPALDFRFYLDDVKPDELPENVVLSYRELDELANGIAHALSDVGAVQSRDALQGDHIVALFLPKSPESFISILGVCKANASWCPIDVEWPLERQAALFKKCKARFILISTDADHTKLKRMDLGDGITILRADHIVAEAKQNASRRQPLNVVRSAADQLAYLVWTSGTTGLPKAVGIQHSAAVQAMRALQMVVPHDPPVRYLQFSEYTFDLSIMDEFWTWGLGGTVCCGTRALHLDSLTAVANATETTHVILTPAVSAELRRDEVPSMKVLINGGEKLSQVVADEWSKNCCLLNLYGPAEATLIAMHRHVPQGDVFKAPNIGVALPTTKLALIDRHGNVVPRGAIGELTIGGPQVARGYVGDPTKTAEKFIEHPVLGRVYRTGDLTRQLWSGEIEYLGREDDQVKINGVRIELLEINAAIKDCHDEVKDSDTMALPRPHSPESLQIVNFSVVPRTTGDADAGMIRTDPAAAKIAQDLRTAALLRLPSNMVPSHFLILSRFPKTSSAKIDRVAIKQALKNFDYMAWERKIGSDADEDGNEDDNIANSGASEAEAAAILASALASVYGVEADQVKAAEVLKLLAAKSLTVGRVNASSQKAPAKPQSAAEELVRKLLGDVCGIEPHRIGRNTPLPALGLTSFKAMSLTRKLLAEGIKCSVLSIIEHNTLASLSSFIESANSKFSVPDGHKELSPPSPPATDSTGEDAGGEQLIAQHPVLTTFSNTLSPAVAEHLRTPVEDIAAVLPCAPLQEGMLFESQRRKGAYWPFRRFDLNGPHLHLEQLVVALRRLVDTLENFRTGFLEASDISVDTVASLLPSRPNFVQVVFKKTDALVEALEIPEDADFEDFMQQRAAKTLHHEVLSGRPPVALWATRQGNQFRFVIHAHHATYDGQTLSILERMASQFYSNPLGQPSVAFHQFQQALPSLLPLSAEALQEQQRTWKQALSHFPSAPESRFPNLCDERIQSTSPKLISYIQRGKTAWSQIEEASMLHECSPRIIAQVAWARLLAAYSEASDVLIGESVSGRDKDSLLSNVAGFVVTTVPVPISFGKGQSFAQVIHRTRNFHEQVSQHQHAPMSVVRSELQLPSDRSVLGSVFLFNPAQGEQGQGGELSFGSTADFGVSVEHDIALHLNIISDGAIEIELNAAESHISLGQLQVLVQQYDAVLGAICKDANIDSAHFVDRLPDHLRSTGAVTPWANPSHQTGTNSAAWLAHWARQSPESPALEFHSTIDGQGQPRVLSYGELDQASSHLAAELYSRIGTQRTVAVCLKRQPATYIALLAILRSSNVYLPIDEALPDERKQLLFKNSGASLLVDEANVRVFSGLAASSSILLGPDTVWDELAQATKSVPEPTQNADDIAFCLYTSGSTGQPKGCLLTVRNLSTAIEAFLDVIESKAPDSFRAPARYLARSAEAFDVHLKEVLLAIRTGACIVTAPREVILEDLGLAMKALAPTHAAVVPSLFFTSGRRIQPSDLPSLRMLIVGGEKVSNDIIASWGAQDDVVVLNAYGPTEVTIGVSIAQIRQNSLASNVGKAFPGSQYLIVQEIDGRLEPVIRGQIGELCVVGPQVGKGYLGAESDAFFEWDGARAYRTGDLARMTHDDEVHYAGRADDSQVKVRGARLELGEVDAKLRELAGSSALVATVLVSHPELKDERLVSFYQKSGLSTRSEQVQLDGAGFEYSQQLAVKARTALPAHMTPFLVIPVSAIPLAVISGKVNTRALIKLYQASSLADLRSKLTPSARRELNPAEIIIAEEAQRVLDIDFEITPATNLFEAGMDSLSAIRLSSRLRKRGIQISVAALMTAATIEATSAAASGDGQAHPRRRSDREFEALCADLTSTLDDKLRQSAERVLPCMPLQSSLISISRAEPEKRLYIGQFELPLLSDVDPLKLKASFVQTFRAHEIYRTVFPAAGKALAQVVLRDARDHAVCIDSETSDERQADNFLAKIAVEIIAELDSVPPVRLVHFPRLAKVVVLAHHAVYDGESIPKLLTEVSERYLGRSVLAPAQFGDVVRSCYQSEPSDADAYWKSALNDFAYTPFPNLNGVRAQGSPQRREVQLQAKTSFSKIKKVAQRCAVSPQSLLLSLFSRLYGMFTGEDDVLFGLVLRGRSFEIPGIDAVQGPCVTTVPFFIKGVTRGVQQLAPDVQDRTSRLLPYQHQPLTQIAKAVGRQGALFNTLFAFTTQDDAEFAFCKAPVVSMDAEFDLALEVEASARTGVVKLFANYRDSILNDDQVEIMLKAFDALLDTLEEPSVAVRMPEGLLAVANETPLSIDEPESTFVQRFRYHARHDGTRTAFVFGDTLATVKKYSYAELDEQSTRFARNLRSEAAKIIAVYLPKSPEFYAVLLAVWKAGKTYLPVDPALPDERVQYMLESAQDVAIVTTPELKRSLPDVSAKTLTVPDLDTDADAELPKSDLNAAAYLLFTSGSTGRPKGCLISQRALAAALRSWDQNVPLSPSGRLLQLASIGFDVSLIEICLPLSRGASFGAAPKEVLLEDLEDSFHKLQITCADLPAALASTLKRNNLPPLEWIMTGGDMMSDETLREWAHHGQLINAWGPTETTIGNTLGFMAPNATRNNIGQAYACSSIYVLDAHQQPVVKGCVGELAVGGPQVGEGYIGQPDLTRQKFVQLKNGAKVYLTGDRGRILADGSIECLGRTEQGQVKVNGQRIELDEISATFAKQPQIHDAETLYLQHPSLASKQLVTFLALGAFTPGSKEPVVDDSQDAVHTIREALGSVRRSLATYMVPAHIIPLTSSGLPLTHNNKTDRKALQALYEQLDAQMIRTLGGKIAAVSGGGEELTGAGAKLRAAVAHFCEVDEAEITSTTSIYHLGVDSISAMILAKHLNAKGFDITVQDILQAPTVFALANSASARSTSADGTDSGLLDRLIEQAKSKLGSIEPSLRPTDIPLPCSPLQAGMLSQYLMSDGKAYIHHHVFESNLSVDKVASTWAKLVATRDILRMTFHYVVDDVTSSGSWYQIMRPDLRPAISGIDLVNGDSDAVDNYPAKSHSLSPEEFLASGPHHLQIKALGGSRTQLIFTLHHALYDGGSLPMLFQDFDAIAAGHTPPKRLPFVELLPHLLSSKEDVEHWIEELHGYQPHPLRPNLEAIQTVEAERELKLSFEDARVGCQKLGVSLQVLASLAFAKLLATLSGTSDVVFGEIFSLRQSVANADSVIGPAFNTVPVRVTLDNAERSAKEQLQIIQARNDAGRIHRRASLRDILSVAVRRGINGQLFDALFDFATSVGDSDQYSSIKQVSNAEYDAFGQYTFNLGFVQGREGLRVNVAISSEMAELHSPKSLAESYEMILVTLLDNPSASVLEMPGGRRLEPARTPLAQGVKQEPNGHHSDTMWRSAEEEKVWRAIARASSVAPEDIQRSTSLASLGLDSISTIGVSSKLRREGIRLSAAQILRGATLGGILDSLSGSGKPSMPATVTSPRSAVLATKAEVARRLKTEESIIEQVLPILSGQALMIGFWLKSGRRSGVYSFPLRAPPGLNMARLSESWKELVKRNHCLRTTFASVQGTPVQVVFSATSQPSHVAVVAVEAGQTLDGTIADLIKKENAKPHPFYTPPVSLFYVHDASPTGDAAIVLRLFHGLYDAVSLNLIIQDLIALYDGRHPAGDGDFGKVAIAIDRSVTDLAKSDTSKAFWRKALKSADRTMVAGKQSGTGPAPQSYVLDKQAFCGVRKAQAALHGTESMSLQTLFIAAVGDAIGSNLGIANPVLLLQHAGRTAASSLLPDDMEIAIDQLAGPTTTLTPVRVARGTQDAPTSKALPPAGLLVAAQQLSSDLLERIDHEQTLLGDIYECGGLRDFKGPLTNVTLNVVWYTSASSAFSQGAAATKPWSHFSVGEASELESQEALPAEEHALDGIDLSTPGSRFGFDRMDSGLGINIYLDEEADAVAVGAVSLNGGHSEVTLRQMVAGIVSRVAAVLAAP